MSAMGNQDALTGLFCRSAFETDKLSPELNARLAAVILIDFDHFARFNREYGRAMADFMLAMQAERLHNLHHLYASRTYRYEGDHFVQLIFSEQGIPASELLALAEDIRRTLNRDVKLRSQTVRCTATQVVALKTPDLSLSQLMTQAHLELARAQGQHGDQVLWLNPQRQPERYVS